ncbi:MAG: phosphoribosylamine--glycine ligase [Nitrospirota bacterium]|nr:phosphoribosylamine--glycine ligase [Nitrospirota bacterium]MDH5769394.1 phosphoribosylamine--glycine ligase [Nitrospirota bacterium]
MKVLVIGGGGREHAIVWKLSQSRHVNRIYCCPGNAGIAEIAECIEMNPLDFDALIDFVKYEWIDLTIVGSEVPLSKSIVDTFKKEGCRIFGPIRDAAQLGISRVFAKDFMRLHRIPTAEYKVFTSYLHAEDYVRLKGTPIVIKTDGLIGDRGIFLASTMEEAIEALRLIMKDMAFGNSGKRVIIEENMKGEKVSFMIFTDGNTLVPLATSKKHDCMFDGEKGPYTAGMGAYSPAAIITKDLRTAIIEEIMRPAVKALNSQGIKFNGILYAELIIDKGKPYVSELSCSFGNPETQTVLPRLKTDLMDIALAITDERLSDITVEWKKESSVCVIVSSEGYPEKFQNGVMITGLEKVKEMKDVVIFHEGTTFRDKSIVTSGGRVFGITAIGDNIKDARRKAYNAVEKIYFAGMHYRKDIGNR